MPGFNQYSARGQEPVLNPGFQVLDGALEEFDEDEAARTDIYEILAAILHLGNVKFEENTAADEGCIVNSNSSSTQSLAAAARLIGIGYYELNQALTSRAISIHGTEIR